MPATAIVAAAEALWALCMQKKLTKQTCRLHWGCLLVAQAQPCLSIGVCVWLLLFNVGAGYGRFDLAECRFKVKVGSSQVPVYSGLYSCTVGCTPRQNEATGRICPNHDPLHHDKCDKTDTPEHACIATTNKLDAKFTTLQSQDTATNGHAGLEHIQEANTAFEKKKKEKKRKEHLDGEDAIAKKKLFTMLQLIFHGGILFRPHCLRHMRQQFMWLKFTHTHTHTHTRRFLNWLWQMFPSLCCAVWMHFSSRKGPFKP